MMESKKSNPGMKFWIVLTFLSLFGTVTGFEYCQAHSWTLLSKVAEFALLALFILSFYMSFIRSGLWEFTHRPLNKLDERELAVVNRSLRYGYSIFTVLVLCLLLLIAMLNLEISIVLAVSLILFAHLVPASVIGFSGKSYSYGRE
jgi:hypothetical protein